MLRPGDPAALAREAALGLLASWSACSAPSVTCSSYGTSSVLSSKASTENSDSIPLPLVNRSLQLQGTCRRTFVKLVGLLGLPGSCSRHTKELIGDGDVESPPPPLLDVAVDVRGVTPSRSAIRRGPSCRRLEPPRRPT